MVYIKSYDTYKENNSNTGPPAQNIFEDGNVVINLNTGKMFDCIISKYAGHDIEMFKAGQSNSLKGKKFSKERNKKINECIRDKKITKMEIKNATN